MHARQDIWWMWERTDRLGSHVFLLLLFQFVTTAQSVSYRSPSDRPERLWTNTRTIVPPGQRSQRPGGVSEGLMGFMGTLLLIFNDSGNSDRRLCQIKTPFVDSTYNRVSTLQ